ncbi:hypothetical protein ARC97_00795 [Escherichia coli]|uniref:SAM-dependent DNA methyltransferase n=1 Tax=Salmonella enterica TaxID=28901 RepID=A0A5Y6GEF7_SALER|nr:type I restriction-modification system subunit M N-terminal domain-containing protein [Escherichia coli]EBZ4376029.1 hypothetical protein [Salmonella enterica subsp. enterica serovar Derby]ECK6746038.1 SAM-dependent DNA methyltransferase [Salmonella enterica]EDJ6507426.1 hypothetical protein [Salmonella enterica subsp. enterica serovar Enteritidis]EGI2519835.1 SAM-dependent DNA methyltransferase [Salmonella enterica subsp. enterica serovar Anatum]HDN7313752.1 type I restriction-modification
MKISTQAAEEPLSSVVDNKQQIAAKIWESANQMRSKIEANEYKDYILGFIFYKYLSDQLVRFVTGQGDDTRSWIVVHRTVKTYLKS